MSGSLRTVPETCMKQYYIDRIKGMSPAERVEVWVSLTNEERDRARFQALARVLLNYAPPRGEWKKLTPQHIADLAFARWPELEIEV